MEVHVPPQRRRLREHHERTPITFPRSNEPPWTTDTSHFNQGLDGIRQVDEYLVCMNDIKRVVWEREVVVQTGNLESAVLRNRRLRRGPLDRIR